MRLLLFALVNLVHDIFNQTFQTNFYFSASFCLFILYQRTLGHLYIKGNETSVTQKNKQMQITFGKLIADNPKKPKSASMKKKRGGKKIKERGLAANIKK